MVPPGSPAEMAAAIEQIAVEADLRTKLSTQALERVRQHYTLERMIDRTVEVYETARARHAAR